MIWEADASFASLNLDSADFSYDFDLSYDFFHDTKESDNEPYRFCRDNGKTL